MVDYLKPPSKPVEVTPQLIDQINGWRPRSIVPAGLAPFLTSPDEEPGDLTCLRMADVIARAVSSTGCITRDDLVAAGFTVVEIEQHFTEAKRRARVAEMTV